jgi:hypothetical protein
MAIVWADVLAIAPELSTVATGTFQAILTIADRQIDDERWGEFADDGRRYLAAHMATISNGDAGGAAGPIASETLGPMSVSYGAIADVDGELSGTKYGVFYRHLMRLACGPGVHIA